MNIKTLSRTIATIERMEDLANAPTPEGALADLTTDELRLIRSVIKRTAEQRRNNCIDYLKAEGINIDIEV